MKDEEIEKLMDIIEWCDEKDKEQQFIFEGKICKNCDYLQFGCMCFAYESTGQSVLVSENFYCNKFDNTLYVTTKVKK